MEPYTLPPEIQSLKANQKAFQLPDLQLPSYKDIGKNIDAVFTRTGDKLTPREPTFQEKVDESVRKFSMTPDLFSPIGEYSKEESKGYNNPALPYNPMVDMNELYAKYDPTTWGDSVEKAWDTFKINSWSGTKNLYYGLKTGITEGRVSAIWDNPYADELANISRNLDEIKPMRFSEDEKDSWGAFLKQLLPSSGYIASGAVEITGQHLAMTAIGAAVGAVAGGGVLSIPEAIGGAVWGNVVALGRDLEIIANTITNINRAATALSTTSKAISALSTANKIRTGGQLLARGLLAANGEAALNSQMAEFNSLELQKKTHYEETGKYLSGQELLDAEKKAHDTGSFTMALGLPLIAASEIFQFGNLLRGKFVPQVTEKLAFRISSKTGEAIMKPLAPYLKVFGHYTKELTAEGLEEFGGGVIEDASVNYFTQRLENRKNYLNTFVDSAWNRAWSKEGRDEFYGGAIIGGISNLPTLFGVGAVKRNTKEFVDKYNTATNAYFHALGNALTTDTGLKEALKTGDTESAKEIYQSSIIQMVNAHSKAGSTQAFSETLDSISGMDNAEFNKHFNISVTKEEQDALMMGVTQEYKAVVKQRKTIDAAFQVNPFHTESWFQEKINATKDGFDIKDKEAAAQEVWDVFKDTLTDNLVRYGDVGKVRKEIEVEGMNLSPEFITLTGKDIPALVASQKELLKQKIAAQLPGYNAEEALLKKLDATTDLTEQYKILLGDAEKRTPGLRKVIQEHNKQLAMEDILLNNLKKLNSKAGQRKAIKKILDWQKYYEEEVVKQDDPAAAAAAAAAAVPPDPAAVPPDPAAVPPDPAAVPPDPAAVPPDPAAKQPWSFFDETATEMPAEMPRDGENGGPSTTEPYLVDTMPGDEVDLEELYGEGKGEEYVAPKKPVAAPEPVGPKNKNLPDPIDTGMPEDIQIDNTTIQRAVDNLEEGEQIIPADSGVTVMKDGEEITKIFKEDEKVKGEKKDGSVVEIAKKEVPLLEVDKAPIVNNPIADFVNREGLSPETQILLTNLQKSGYIEFNCN